MVHLAWKARNDLIFRHISLSLDQMVRRIWCQATAYSNSSIDHCKVVTNDKNGAYREISWRKPEEGWCKLNCDGAVIDVGCRAGCGGIVRDENGGFVIGFAAGLGACSCTEAELWAVLRGLQLVKDRGIQSLAIETDFMVAINLISGGCSSFHPCFNLVKDIRDLLDQLRNYSVEHTFREANQVADGLAKFSLGLDNSCNIFTSLLPFVSVAFAADFNGVTFPRGY